MAGGVLTIACAINRLYLQPLLVTLTSLVAHLPAGTPVRLYVLHRDLTAKDIERLSVFARVSAASPPMERIAGLPLRSPFTPEAYGPLLLPDVLPASLDRVLYLDADLLVLDDLTPLWQSDMAGAPLAAVQDAAIPLVSSRRGLRAVETIGIPASAPYFNAGVMLMDLEAWRRENVTARAVEYLRAAAHVDFLHQEALNAVLWDGWRPLPARWNVIAGLAGRFGVELPNRPAIAHFAGHFKPWLAPVGGPFGAAYQHVLDRTERPDAPRPVPGVRARLAGAYDRRLRRGLYPLERLLWSRRFL